MTSQSNVLISIATYNEIENLPSLVDKIFEHAPNVDILIVDDNSPDGTGQWVDQRAAEDSRVACLHRAGKLGLGTATLAAFRHALQRKYDYVVTMDADFSHPPEKIPALIAEVQADRPDPVDVSIGSRYVPQGGIQGWPFYRHFMSRCVNLWARSWLGLNVRDCSGQFRCYRADFLRKIDFDHIRSTGYSYVEEILWRLSRAGARFSEIPIVFVDRQQGTSKINHMEALNAVWLIFYLGVSRPFRRRS